MQAPSLLTRISLTAFVKKIVSLNLITGRAVRRIPLKTCKQTQRKAAKATLLAMNPHVKVEQGELEGCISRGVLQFLGVRYAAPPTGNLRWQAPQHVEPVTGITPAKDFGPVCPQSKGATSSMRDASNQDEDCLLLNVWTCTLDPGAKLSVIFWIHGGGNLGGAGSDVECDGRRNAKRGAVVFTAPI